MASLAIVSAISLISPRRWAKRILVVGLPLVGAVGVVLVYAWWHYLRRDRRLVPRARVGHRVVARDPAPPGAVR
jgi:hypothetical protein